MKMILIFLVIVTACSCTQNVLSNSFFEYKGQNKFYSLKEIEIANINKNIMRKKYNLSSLAKLEKKVTIPISMIDTSKTPTVKNIKPFVPIKLNNKEFYVVFDTGAPVLLLPLSILRILGMEIEDNTDYFEFFINTFDNSIQKSNYYRGVYTAKMRDSYYGWLGWTTYSRFCENLTIDFRAKELIINDDEPTSKHIDCEINEYSEIIIPVVIDGIQGKALLDTGWGSSNLCYNSLMNFDVSDKKFNYSIINTFSGLSYFETFLFKSNKLQIQSTTVYGLDFEIVHSEKDNIESDFTKGLKNKNVDIILGYSFFEKCRVTINFNKKKCWIIPHADEI